MSNTEVTKELGRLWREEMGDADKEEFLQAAADDKQRYDREMAAYNPGSASPTKKAPVKKPAAKKEAPAKKPAAKKTPTKKAAKKSKEESQLEEAYAIFVEVESEAAAQERVDGEEEPFTAEEMEEHLTGIWEDLSPEDRLEYLEARE